MDIEDTASRIRRIIWFVRFQVSGFSVQDLNCRIFSPINPDTWHLKPETLNAGAFHNGGQWR